MPTHFRCAPRADVTDHRAALMALAKRRLEDGETGAGSIWFGLYIYMGLVLR
jgi:hypothetical protein